MGAVLLREIMEKRFHEIQNNFKCASKKYGYTFEHEATYDKICLVNDAVYIAKGLSFHSQNLDADEFLDVVKIPFDEALRMVLDNEIKDGKTQIAIMKAGLMQK